MGLPGKTIPQGPGLGWVEEGGLINEREIRTAYAQLRLVSVQLSGHLSSRKEHLCLTVSYLHVNVVAPETIAMFSCMLQPLFMSNIWTSGKGDKEKRAAREQD